MSHYNYDDFGKFNGSQFFESGADAREWACAWPIDNVGKRSKDYAKRDLLLGSMQADQRNWAYRLLVKNRHPELFEGLDAFDVEKQHTIARARAFLFFHYLSLDRFDKSSDPMATALTDRLLKCPPNLFYVSSSEHATRLRSCGLSNLCPFCLTRRAEYVYDRIKRHSDEPDTVYLLVSVTSDIDSLFDEDRNLVPELRRRMSASMREFAQNLRACAGITTFQVGPFQDQRVRFDDGDFDHSTWDLRFTARSACLLKLSLDQMTRNSSGLDTEDIRNMPAFAGVSELGGTPELVVERDQERDAIRSLVFGEAPGSQVSATKKGYPGLISYQQWHLASLPEWKEYVRAVQGTNLFTFWGDWNRAETRERKVWIPASASRGKHRRRMALTRANEDRRSTADQKAAEAAARLLPPVEEYKLRRGRAPGRTQISKLAETAGIKLSEREVRRVVHLMKSKQENSSNAS